MKTCRRCGIEKPNDSFNKRSKTLDGLQSYCRECSAKYMDKGYGWNIFKVYGITAEERQEMFENQNGKCAICFCEEKLFIDHDHETGKVRALLCNKCNAGLGYLRDDAVIVENAMNYLKRFKLQNVLPRSTELYRGSENGA